MLHCTRTIFLPSVFLLVVFKSDIAFFYLDFCLSLSPMSHVTADLEYFQCDMCAKYLHKDIFCDHRRDCKGLHSTELKRAECKRIEEALGKETRRMAAEREEPREGTTGVDRVFLSIEEEEKRKEAAVRRNVSDAYQRQLDKELEERLLNPQKQEELLLFLKS
ncbi:hypothetical protein AGDE_04818 [Angomonas deanei]|nr:hypothetical protein AGDE_04818 [Angomonas deanei]|eukprot:EPY39111.1 hypothetical protein AGDE_04818 [Angomonas deanei]